MRLRQNATELTDDTLYWYSRAVKNLKAKDINDPTSWWYLAGVHGYSTNPFTRQFWPSTPPSPATLNSGFWNRCQHATWYFLPWHRMYLFYFERIVAQAVVEEGGPDDWALPYWNYCNSYNPDLNSFEQTASLAIPAEFGSAAGADTNTPDLFVAGRTSYIMNRVNTNPSTAMAETLFTNDQGLNFGGGVTGFAHFGNAPGQVENLPHNVIHGNVGGAMSDPNAAALDPIFWLHHANIDRLWAIWANLQGRSNPTDLSWLDFKFKFHDADGSAVEMKVRDVLDIEQQLDYQYTVNYPDVPLLSVQPPPVMDSVPPVFPFDVIGASVNPDSLLDPLTPIPLDMVAKSNRNATLPKASQSDTTSKKSQVRISNVRGQGSIPPIDVFINAIDGDPEQSEHFVGSIGLFGLEDASTPSVEQDGSGLSFILDASEAIEKLRRREDWDEEQLNIRLVPQSQLADDANFEVGRVSVHSEVD